MREREPTVLLVDDDETFSRVLSRELGRRGYRVATASTGAQALELATRAEPDAILLDLRLPDLDGIQVLERLRALPVQASVIMLTGHGTIDTAIRAIRLGADDYLEKPCPIEKVEVAVNRACEHVRLVERHRILQDGWSAPDVRSGFIGRSPEFQRMCRAIERIGASDSTTLILGETGTGKEMVAQLLHHESPRREAPFVVVDCTALQQDLLLSELFGHEKGAFSGALRLKHGLFEVADRGTLLLDEVGDASPEIQSMLLRVLETGSFRRVGGTREISVDVRVVSATNRDLEAMIAEKRFREDLYFRLSPLTLRVPPLRERREDVPLLVAHFAERLGRRLGRTRTIGADAMRSLEAYSWPGNVRELIHALEQAMVMAEDEVIGPEDLSIAVRASDEASGGGAAAILPLDEVQRRHVLAALETAGGNRARAAGMLGISERNLYRLIHRYGWRREHRSGPRPAGAGRGGPSAIRRPDGS